MEKINSDNWIVKSNSLVEASYTLTVNEQRVLMACISQIDSRNNTDFDFSKGIKLSVDQIQDLFYKKSDKRNAYRDLKNATDNLYRRELRLYTEDKKQELLTRWVSEVIFNNEEQCATLFFYGKIQPFLTKLGSKFTEYRLKNIVQLTSIYAIRIYELIVRWSFNNSYKEMEISDFKYLLDLGSKYKQHGQFNDYVIKPAVEQINTYTDFQIEITFRKKGRAFKWIQLRFNKKQQTQALEDKEPMNVQALTYWTSSRQALKHLCDKYGVDIDLLLNSLKKREHPENKGQQHYDNLTDKYLSKVIAKACKYVQTEDYIKTEIKELRSMTS